MLERRLETQIVVNSRNYGSTTQFKISKNQRTSSRGKKGLVFQESRGYLVRVCCKQELKQELYKITCHLAIGYRSGFDHETTEEKVEAKSSSHILYVNKH